jgi:hypothetical protein
MGNVTGSGDYAVNTDATITATANPGYRFVQWNDGNIQNPRTVTVTQDIVFTAIFVVAIPGTFHVSVFTNNTNMGNVTGSGDYAVNTGATITATANPGYHFVQWNDGNTQNPRTITVIQDIAFTAEFAIFEQNTYQVNLLSNDQTKGSVIGGGSYLQNTTISIGAIANQGYYFAQWNDGNTQNPRIFTLTQDTTFIATFEQTTGITDIETSAINVYPNPARDNINIVLPENISSAIFTLYDMQGKVLIQQQISNQDAVSIDNIATGIYIYKVTTDKQNYTRKIVIND